MPGDDGELETLSDLKVQAHDAYAAVTGAVHDLQAIVRRKLSPEDRAEAAVAIQRVQGNAAYLRNLLQDIWLAAEQEAERYHELKEALEDAAATE